MPSGGVHPITHWSRPRRYGERGLWGIDERFPARRRPLSAQLATFTDIRGNGRDAPSAVIPTLTPERGSSTQSRSLSPVAMPAHAPKETCLLRDRGTARVVMLGFGCPPVVKI
jgi:hypothetical protein